jgi:EpsI family protein
MRNLRRFAPAAVLAAGCLLNAGVRPQYAPVLAHPLRSVPMSLAGYAGTERSVPPAEARVAGMSDYIFRVFSRDSVNAFSIYVGYYRSQTTGRTIHSPKNCLPGAGWQSVESGSAALDLGDRRVTVNRYILANGSSQALVYYWYQGRGRVAWNEYRVKWDLLRDAIRYGRTEEALVRIVVPVVVTPGYSAASWRESVARAEAVARSVAVELVPDVDAALPAWSPAGPRA